MAIYHCTTKPLSRSTGRSAVAAAAYRSGEKIRDERIDKLHDYTNRSGVMDSYTLLPSGEPCDRSELWNAAEAAEKRKDARTAREWIVAIPDELVSKTKHDELWNGNPDQELVKDFAKHLSETYGVAVDVAIHAPDKKGDQRNYHAHILTTTRQAKLDNGKIALSDKATIELSDKKRGELKLGKAKTEVKNIREVWADLANKKLEKQQKDVRIDHRSLQDQGIDRLPQIHVGVTANNMERKGKPTERSQRNNEIKQLNAEIIHLEEIRERQKEVERMQSALQEEKRKQEQEKKKQQKEQEEQQRRQKAEQEKQEQERQEEQKQREASTPEQVKNTYEHLLHAEVQAVIKKARPIHQKAFSKFCRAAETWHSKQPNAPSGLLSLFKKKAYERDLQTWENNKEKAGRIMQVYRHRHKVLKEATYSSSGNSYSTLADRVAIARIKRSHPELSNQYKAIKERESKQQEAEQLEKRKQLDKEREVKRKEREQARRRSRSRSRGRGGMDF